MSAATEAHTYSIIHETRYTYSRLVANGHHFGHLTPRNTDYQQVLEHRLDFEPEPTEISEMIDYYGNHSLRFLINYQHDLMQITATSTVTVRPREVDTSLIDVPWEMALCDSIYTVEPVEVAELRLPSPHVECLAQTRQYAARFFTPERPWLDAMLDLTRAIRADFVYDTRATDTSTPVAEVFENKRGVCQDFSHLMLSCLRSLNLPARYVSGYILNEPPPGVAKLTGGDASHAWIESWLPGVGWVGFDPTNGKIANIEFITLAWGRDFMDVTPLRGVVLGGGHHELDVSVWVKRIDVD